MSEIAVLSEGIDITVLTAWGPKYGGLIARCVSNPCSKSLRLDVQLKI